MSPTLSWDNKVYPPGSLQPGEHADIVQGLLLGDSRIQALGQNKLTSLFVLSTKATKVLIHFGSSSALIMAPGPSSDNLFVAHCNLVLFWLMTPA